MYETIEQLMQAAHANDADAQWDLAVRYANGNEVEQSNEKAFEWICRAAENGHEGAANYVLDAYENGKEELGIQPDIEKLVEFVDKYSDHDNDAIRRKYIDLFLSEATRDRLSIHRAFTCAGELASKGIHYKGNIHFYTYVAYSLGLMVIDSDTDAVSLEDQCAHYELTIKYMNMLSGTEDEPPIEKKAKLWWHYAFCLYKDNKFDECRPWFEMAIPYDANTELLYSMLLFTQAEAQGENSPLFIEAYNHAKNGIKRSDHEKDKGLERSTYRNLSVVTCYGSGGTPVDLDASYRWCVRAAELGDETSKQRLPHYHKKLFGGYTFK